MSELGLKLSKPILLLVYGPGSGYGKSTLSRALADWLKSEGNTGRLYLEEAVLEEAAFSEYVDRVREGRGDDIGVLLESCEKFVEELRRRDADVVVLDSILPCWDWLYSAGVSDEVVFEFTERLSDLLSDMSPILLFIEGDVDVVVERAVEERGVTWATELATKRTDGHDVNALRTYFRELRAGAERAKSRWSYPIVEVDTVGQDLESAIGFVTTEISKRLG